MKRALDRAWRWAALGAVTAHLALTALYVTPENPLRAELLSVLTATIGRFFAQDWRLFAPNPADTGTSVLVSCLDAEETAEAVARADAGVPVSGGGPWFDLTTPLVEAHQRNRFSSYARVHRAQVTAARGVLALPVHLVPWQKACQQGDAASCDFVAAQLELAQGGARAYLGRVATSYCRAEHPSAAGVGVRVRQQGPVPWSRRATDAPPAPRDFDVLYAPMVAGVSAATAWSHP